GRTTTAATSGRPSRRTPGGTGATAGRSTPRARDGLAPPAGRAHRARGTPAESTQVPGQGTRRLRAGLRRRGRRAIGEALDLPVRVPEVPPQPARHGAQVADALVGDRVVRGVVQGVLGPAVDQ